MPISTPLEYGSYISSILPGRHYERDGQQAPDDGPGQRHVHEQGLGEKRRLLRPSYQIHEGTEYGNIWFRAPPFTLLIQDPYHTIVEKGSLRAMRFLTAISLNCNEHLEQVSRELWTRIWTKVIIDLSIIIVGGCALYGPRIDPAIRKKILSKMTASAQRPGMPKWVTAWLKNAWKGWTAQMSRMLWKRPPKKRLPTGYANTHSFSNKLK